MVKNIIQSLITRGSVSLINFLILLISARYLGVESRGEISLFILNITIVQIINEVYTGYSLVYFIPRFDLKKIIVAGVGYTFIFCSFSNLLIIFLGKQVPNFEWMGYVISLLVIFNTFNCILLLGKQHIRMFNLLSFIQPFLLLCSIVFSILVLKEYTFRAFVYPLLFSFVMAFVISSFYVFKLLRSRDFSENFRIQPILFNGLLYQSSIFIYIIGNRYSYYLLQGNSDVGLYSSASSLMEAVLIIAHGITPVLLSRIANRAHSVHNASLALSLARLCFIFSAFLICLVWIIPEKLFLFFMGTGFTGIKSLMMLYAPGVLLISFFIPLCNYFSAIGKQNIVLLCYIPGFICTLLLVPFLINIYGIRGAPLAANMVYAVHAVIVGIVFFKSQDIPVPGLFALHHDFNLLKKILKSA